MNDLVVSRATSMLSIRCSSSDGAEGDGHQRLGLPAGEERRAVRPRQHAGLDGDRPDGVGVPAVHPLALVEHLRPHDAVLDFLDLVADVAALIRELGGELLDDVGLDLGDALGAPGLVLGVDRLGHRLLGQLLDARGQRGVALGLGPAPSWAWRPCR